MNRPEFEDATPSERGRASGDVQPSRRTWVFGAAAAAAVLLFSVAGLLCLRIDFFDDSAMLLGARLLRAGQLPYVDFYTHYGPMGFVLLGGFLSLPVNPGVALRIAQSAFFLAAAIALYVLGRRFAPRVSRAAFFLPLLLLSAVFQLPAFLGFLFAFSAVTFFLFAGDGRARAGPVLAAAAGVCLSVAALVRPAFAAYAAAALIVVAVVGPGRRRPAVFCAVAAAAAAGLLWLLLFRAIPIQKAVVSALLGPAHLVRGGARFLAPQFFPAVSGRAGRALATFCGGALIFATSAAWAVGIRAARAWRIPILVLAAGGLGACVLQISPDPGRDSNFVAAALFAFAAALAWRARGEIRQSPTLAAAVLFGMASCAFGHYFWQRPDRPHLVPLLALAAAGALPLAEILRARGRVLLAVLFAGAYLAVWEIPWAPFPGIHLWNGGIRRILEHAKQPGASWRTLWPAGELPLDAAAAVSFADRYSGPSSRFVAVGSSQAWSSGNPILLFLLSARLPYTRWWAYDPGVQSSPKVQAEMKRELESSGSRTALVWPAEGFLFERDIDISRRTPFDDAFDALYPIRGPRFALYELRLKKTDRAIPPGPSEK